jgi:probable addiction module antidote protein
LVTFSLERNKDYCEVSRFDASNYLDSEEMIAEYLDAALEEGNSELYLSALRDVDNAREMSATIHENPLALVV